MRISLYFDFQNLCTNFYLYKKGGVDQNMYSRIRDLRNDHDMTQKELAKILGMSQTGYSKYETGENDIPTEILIKLSNIYDVSIDYLLDQTDSKKRHK